VGDAQSGFALLRMRESGGQGTCGEPVRYRPPGRGSEKQGLWKYLCWSSGPVDHKDVPWMETGLESAPRWGCNEVGNPICCGPHSWHKRLPMGGSRAGAGSNDKLNSSEGERGR